MSTDLLDVRDTIATRTGSYTIYRLDRLEAAGLAQIDRLPFSIRILLESVLRNLDGKKITRQDVLNLANWQTRAARPSMGWTWQPCVQRWFVWEVSLRKLIRRFLSIW